MENNITERLYDAMEPFNKTFNIPYCDEDFYQALAAFADSDRSNRSKCWDDLKKMLRGCGYTGDLLSGKGYDFYRELVLDLIDQGVIKTSDQISQQVRGICEQLFQDFKSFPTPAAYMQRLVDNLCNPEDPWQNDTLRLRILKQFIKYGGCLEAAGVDRPTPITTYISRTKGVRINLAALPDHLDDGLLTDDVFSLLINSTKDQRKHALRLLAMADSLASGLFVEERSKKDLYLFAICYNMIFAAHPAPGIIVDEKCDIEQQLFTDYYAANAFIFLTEAYRKDPNNTIVDPTGTTINFKNPAELVHLYYICKPSKPFNGEEISSTPGAMSALEKLNAIATMLEEIQHAGEENVNAHAADRQPGATIVLKNRFKAGSPEDPLSLPEEEFKKFLLANYDCRRGNASAFSVNSGANTAKEKYVDIVQRLQAKAADLAEKYKGIPELEDAVYRYGLFFDEAYSQSIGSEPAQDDDRRDFLTILHRVNKILQDENLIKDCKPDNVKAETVTRTKLLAALYYDFNDRHSGTKGKRYGFSFQQHFHQFTEEIDKVLVECNFTPISPKSLLDMLLVYSSYVCINE